MSLKPESKGYLVDTISAFSPWSSRSATPKPPEETSTAVSEAQRGGDHTSNHKRKISLKSYPPDCPSLNVQWYHAVDVAKRKPNYAKPVSEPDKPVPPPKKWAGFTVKDSRAIEAAFQNTAREDDVDLSGNSSKTGTQEQHHAEADSKTDPGTNVKMHGKPNRSIDTLSESTGKPATKVPVNEDYLFDVDIENRELGPAYWLGPVYEVRRGSWFYTDGAALRPCDESLAFQLEEGYIKAAPWRLAAKSGDAKGSDTSRTPSRASSPPAEPRFPPESSSVAGDQPGDTTGPIGPATWRLFGVHMNTVAQYQDASTAWLLTDDFFSRMSSTVYQRFAGGAHLSGTKVVRGYSDLSRKRTAKDNRDTKDTKRPRTPTVSSDSRGRTSPDRSAATTQDASIEHEQSLTSPVTQVMKEAETERPEPETTVMKLERRMTSLIAAALPADPAKQDEEAEKLAEKEISEDYRDTSGEKQDREIAHLILVTHGIGQRLGQRFETFNFIHDVNELRKMLKAVYNSSPDLQALNDQVEKLPKNCRIQVLPVCWRHLLDFPNQSLKHNRKEYDLADTDEANVEEQYPSLQDITVEGVPAVRNIVADLALDILLYQTPAYKGHISRIVVEECNRSYKLFRQRNPSFHGKVSLCGHSLGSALFFDILSDQVDDAHALQQGNKRGQMPSSRDFTLDFPVENLILLGSPVGLFQMLQGKTIVGHQNSHEMAVGASSELDNPFAQSFSKKGVGRQTMPANTLVSSPKCRQVFNIFHPTDPIAYRLEPLITASMSNMKPQNLPYVKKSFLGAPMGQGLTGIPAMVGQSVSGFWSNLSSGLTDRFIHRSLGITAEDAAKLSTPMQSSAQTSFQPPGAGTNIVAGGVLSAIDAAKRRLSHMDISGDTEMSHPPTLIDNEMETLYAGFQKEHKESDNATGTGSATDAAAWLEAEEHGRKLKREEAKVRALNSNGRVDYSIQE